MEGALTNNRYENLDLFWSYAFNLIIVPDENLAEVRKSDVRNVHEEIKYMTKNNSIDVILLPSERLERSRVRQGGEAIIVSCRLKSAGDVKVH